MMEELGPFGADGKNGGGEGDGEGVGQCPDSDLGWVQGEIAAFAVARGAMVGHPNRSG